MDPLDLMEGKDAHGRIGTIDIGADPGTFRSRGQVLRDLVITVLLCAGATTAAFLWLDVGQAVIAVIAFAVYCLVAFFVRARPNHDHLGVVGNAFDHPLRVSDDANRALLGIAVLFALGRYVSVSLVGGLRYLRRGELPHDRLLR